MFAFCSCFRANSGSIPGIFSPGRIVRTAVFGLIPGAGDEFRSTLTLPLAGIPGVVFADGWTGWVENPGGRLALSAAARFAFAAAFAFASFVDELQAKLMVEIVNKIRSSDLDIIYTSMNFKIAVPA
jgi:hypothetical protein